MVLISFMNQMYMKRNALTAIPTLANIFILAIGVYLLVKSLIVVNRDNPLTLGKTLFASLTMALIAALCNIGAYQHIKSNKVDQFEHFKTMQVQAIENYVAQDSTLNSPEKKTEKKKVAIENLEEKLKVGTYASFEIQMYLSIAMIVTLLVYVALKK